MNELKNCPFCGSEVEIKIIQSGIGLRSAIRCKNTDCYMGYPGGFTSWHTDESEEQVEERLATAWNRRAENGEEVA